MACSMDQFASYIHLVETCIDGMVISHQRSNLNHDQKFPEIRDQQTRDLLNIYSKLDKSIPLVCVCGNCDIGNGGLEIEAGLFNLSWC